MAWAGGGGPDGIWLEFVPWWSAGVTGGKVRVDVAGGGHSPRVSLISARQRGTGVRVGGLREGERPGREGWFVQVR